MRGMSSKVFVQGKKAWQGDGTSGENKSESQENWEKNDFQFFKMERKLQFGSALQKGCWQVCTNFQAETDI